MGLQIFILTTIALAAQVSWAQFNTGGLNQGGFPTQLPSTGLPGGTNTLGGYPGTNFGGFPTNNLGGFPSNNVGGFPGQQPGYPSILPSVPRAQQPLQPNQGNQRRNRLATLRTKNPAGDELTLTFEELDDYNDRDDEVISLFGQQYRYSDLFGRRDDDDSNVKIRVHGRFIKNSALAGTPTQGSLSGIYAMVITENGNMDGYCMGTGNPLRGPPRRGYNPYANLFPGNNYFNQIAGQNRPGPILHVSTPLYASTGTSTVEGVIQGVRLRNLYGRGLHICVDNECHTKTDLCGVIAHDTMSIEQFALYKQQYQQHLQIQQQLQAQQGGALGGLPGGTNPLAPATGGLPGGSTIGDPTNTGGGLF